MFMLKTDMVKADVLRNTPLDKAVFLYLASLLLFFFMTLQQYKCQKEIKAELKEVKIQIELLRQEHEHTVTVYDDMIQAILQGAKNEW